MDKKTIAAAVGAMVLTAGAATTSWGAVFDQQPPVTTAVSEPIVTTVYVDQFGNLLDPAALTIEPPVNEVGLELAPIGNQPTANQAPAVAESANQETEYPENEYEEAEEGEHDEHEDDDYEEEDEYEG